MAPTQDPCAGVLCCLESCTLSLQLSLLLLLPQSCQKLLVVTEPVWRAGCKIQFLLFPEGLAFTSSSSPSQVVFSSWLVIAQFPEGSSGVLW